MPRPRYLQEAIRLGWGGAKSNLLPGTLLWIFGITLVVLYYNSTSTAALLDSVGEIKSRNAPWFGMLSTAFFGSLVPWGAQMLFREKGDRQTVRQVFWLFLFWALHGLQIDYFYRIQHYLFGSGREVGTIVMKTLVDEFVWVPFWAIPQIVIGYLLIEKKGSLAELRAAFQRRSFLERAIPLMIANWVVWIPAVSMIYLFPLALQLPLQNIVLGMWCLILIFFAKEE